ncbi:DUF6941 family protein [Rossellomorea vietnamensis]|uniref:DUF6941 family protein n=1 Tax=Rossellomorea vietnamensis TaxID=218284 RepID=UPI003CE6DE53
MARIGYVIVSEDVYGSDRELIIKNPLNSISPYSLPGNFSFVIAFSIIDLIRDTSYHLTIELKDPNKKDVIQKQELDFSYNPPPQVAEKVKSGAMNLAFNNVVFKQEGIHTLTVSVTGGNSHSIEILVHPSGDKE